MVEVRVNKLVYIKDIPLELLKEAIKAGQLSKGKYVGLLVKPDEADEALIELKIMEDGQEELIREGQVIPIDQVGEVFVLDSSWRVYLEREREESDVRRKNDTISPTPSRSP
ncbi:MAG: hypothetical protein ABIH11_08345 [Candidatus Altiarchaeota archaeon]